MDDGREDDEEFTVEAIMDSRGKGKKKEYKVKWHGYPESEATWEPPENFAGSRQMISEFEANVDAQTTAKKSGGKKSIASGAFQKQRAATSKLERVVKKELRKDRIYYEVVVKGKTESEWKAASEVDGDQAIADYEHSIANHKRAGQWPYAKTRGAADDKTRPEGGFAREKHGGVHGGVRLQELGGGAAATGSNTSLPTDACERTATSLLEKRKVQWSSGRVQHVEYLVEWEGDEHVSSWHKESDCIAIGLGGLIETFAGKESISNAGGEKLSNGPAKNLGGRTAGLPTAKRAKAGSANSRGGTVPQQLLARRGQMYKVEWSDLPVPSWISRDAFLAQFSKAKLTALEKKIPAKQREGFSWSGKAIPAAEAAKRWAARGSGCIWYRAALVGGETISLGDAVKVAPPRGESADADEGLEFSLEIVEELWSAKGGEPRFTSRKLFQAAETLLQGMTVLDPSHVYAMDPRRVYLSKLTHNGATLNEGFAASILEKVSVVYAPGARQVSDHESVVEADYFYEMSYDTDNHAFEAVYEHTPFPVHHPESAHATHLVPLQPAEPTPTKLRVLDLYAGTGGLGYLDGKVEKGGQQASIETRWAVDFDKAACDSWKRNRPEVHTYHMSVDDFLFMVEKWDALCKKYENYVASDDDSDSDDDEDEQERLAAPASPAAAAAAVGAGAAAAGGANEGEVMGRGLRKRVQRKSDETLCDEKGRYNEWLANANAAKMEAVLQKRRAEARIKLADALDFANADADAPQFIAAQAFGGAKPGYAFKVGAEGAGYYLDANAAAKAAKLKQAVVAAVSSKCEDPSLERAQEMLSMLEASLEQQDQPKLLDRNDGEGETPSPAASPTGSPPQAEGEEGVIMAPVKESKKLGQWSWTSPMAYRVLASDGVACYGKIGDASTVLVTLKLGTELQCKTGRIDANGDSWLHIGKNGGAGLSKSCWVPSTKNKTRILVEEIPVSEWLVDEEDEEEDYAVEKIVDMRVLNPENTKKGGKKNEPGHVKHFHPFAQGGAGRGEVGELEFKIRWKGWSPEYDEWKTEAQLDCPTLIAAWVDEGLRKGSIPRPGDVDLVCGGPPCQGVSGFNRFRNDDNPLNDPKNMQMPLFMRVIEVLQPTFSLLENVADIWKFPSTWPGIYGKFCVSQHMALGYQSRVGFLTAGRYGVPQYRVRCFIWGARQGHPLPGFPMPTHRVVKRNSVMPVALKGCRVEAPPERRLWREIRMGDILIDFPEITNEETQGTIAYGGINPKWRKELKADEQRRGEHYYRDPAKVLAYYREGAGKTLNNHVPLRMNADDKFRAEHIPLKKGACWSDLGELSADKRSVVRHFRWDPERDNNEFGEKLPPGDGRSADKCIVPQYAVNSMVAGKGYKAALGRAWWDEIYPTCICRMQIHSHKNQHPGQPRSFSAREYARMQGLPDTHYLCGEPAKQFEQVGNAVCARLALNLGKALNLAVLDGAPRLPIVEVEPEPPADDPDAVVAAAGDAADGDEDEGELEEEELRPATKRGGRKTAAAPKGKGGTGGKAASKRKGGAKRAPRAKPAKQRK